MNTKAFFQIIFSLALPCLSVAQSTYFMAGTKEQALLQRLDIKQALPSRIVTTVKPYSRKLIAEAIEMQNVTEDLKKSFKLSAIDKYNMERLLMNNPEWSVHKETYESKKPILKEFYKTPGIFFSVKTPDFFLAVDPTISYTQFKESNNSQNLFYNSRGVKVRGLIKDKIGFDIYVSDNQERDPLYVQQWIIARDAVPGAGFYKPFKGAGGADYFDVKGSISWKAGKHVNMQLGYDKNFVGDGFRSLFLSDFSNNAMFLKFNFQSGKFNFQHLTMELIPNLPNVVGGFLSRNYYKMNYLTYQPNRSLKFGLLYATMYGTRDKFNVLYLLPVINLHPGSKTGGAVDNDYFGLDAKVNIKKTVQVYGQLLVDNLKLSEKNGYWNNKFGHQLGIKYIDALGLKNLDIQVEENRVRPFTYSSASRVGSYVHYYQPLAHPLGANFQEWVGIVRYQPLKKLHLQAKAIYYTQGLDSVGRNFGGNLFVSNTTRPRDYGFDVGSGNMAKCLNASFLASYEVFENMFIDGNFQIRNYKREIGATDKTTVMSIGFRWNMVRRDFDF